MLAVLFARLLGLLSKKYIIDGFDQFNIERIECDLGPPHESVKIRPADGLVAVDALSFPPPDPKPCLPDIGDGGRERGRDKLGFKLRYNVRPTLTDRSF